MRVARFHRLASKALSSFVLLALVGVAFGQNAWEKPIAPGLVYREEVDPSIPRIVHALRFSLRSPAVKAVPELAGGRVYDATALKGRGFVSQMVKDDSALGGVNGDFFPWTGDPLGLMVREGRLISNAALQRATFGWGSEDASATIATYEGTIANDSGTKLKIDAVNRSCDPDEVVLNTTAVGIAMSGTPMVAVVLRPESTALAPSTTVDCRVENVFPDVGKMEVKPATWVLMASGSRVEGAAKLRRGQTVHVDVKTHGFDWDKISNAIGGGPILLQSGKAIIDGKAEDLDSAFTDKRHPRTAIGVTEDGDLWFVAVDGRQETSDGMTLEELTTLMKGLGCRDAINLDGGGSTTLNLLGVTLNRPSDGKERPVANGVLFYGPAPLPTDGKLRIALDDSPAVGRTVEATVVDGSGEELPNAEVLWGATGAAWIDQGGTVRSLKAGKVHIMASVGRQLLSLDVDVAAVAPARAERPRTKAKLKRQSTATGRTTE